MAHKTPDTCTQLLRDMIGFNSVNAHVSGIPDAERPLAEYLETVASQMGLQTQQLAIDGGPTFNMLVTCKIDDAAPWLAFDSHMDTVSIEGMSIDPFAGHVKDGRMYGRGACDTKSSGAAMLWALKQYYAGSEKPNNIAIAFVTDEELYKTGTHAFTKEQLPKLGWKPAGVIVGEPTELAPIIAHNGAVRWTIRTLGVAAHSSAPSQGKSAISMMVRAIDAIESLYIPTLTTSHPLTGKSQCSINMIKGGTQVNVIADSCTVKVDRRTVPGEDAEQVIPTVTKLLDKLAGNDPNFNYEQDDIYIDPTLDPLGSESLLTYVQGRLNAMGLPSEGRGVAYGTDAAQYNKVSSVPTVVIGPGHINQAHTHDEWIALDQVNGAIDLYLNLMRGPLMSV